jgi:hypothetical protein
MPRQLLRLWLLLLRPQEFRRSPAVHVLAAAGGAEQLAFGCLPAAAVGEAQPVQQLPQQRQLQRLLLLAQPGQWVWVCWLGVLALRIELLLRAALPASP